MTNNLILRFALRTENVLGIYRNSISIKWRILLWTGIAIELMAYGFLIHDRILHPLTLDHTYRTIFMCNNILTSLTTLITSTISRTTFKLFLENIEASEVYISNDTTYNINIKRQCKKIKFIFAFIFFLACSQIKFTLDRIGNMNRIYFVTIIHMTSMFLCNIRFLIEFIVLHCVLFILSEQIKYVTRNITKHNAIARRSIENIEIIDDVTQRDIQFEQFSELFMKIKESSKLINATFGVQVSTTEFVALYPSVVLIVFKYCINYGFILIVIINIQDFIQNQKKELINDSNIIS